MSKVTSVSAEECVDLFAFIGDDRVTAVHRVDQKNDLIGQVPVVNSLEGERVSAEPCRPWPTGLGLRARFRATLECQSLFECDCLSARGGGEVFHEPIDGQSGVGLRERARRQIVARSLNPDQVALRRRRQAVVNPLSVRREGKLVLVTVNHQGGNFDLRSVLD